MRGHIQSGVGGFETIFIAIDLGSLIKSLQGFSGLVLLREAMLQRRRDASLGRAVCAVR